jgi:hypothetical protein
VGHPPLREDALRQCAARPRVPPRLAGEPRAAVPAHLRGDAWTGRCASCASPKAASLPQLDADSEGVEASSTRGRRTRCSTSSVRSAGASRSSPSASTGRRTSRAGGFRPREIRSGRTRGTQGRALRGSRAAGVARPRRQAPDRVERAA